MKLKFIIPVVLLGTFAFSQEKEIKNALSLAKDNKTAEATTVLSSIESQVTQNYGNLEPSLLADYYFALGKVAFSTNNNKLAAEHFAKVNELESNPYFVVKNKDTKAVSYVYSKAEATSLESGNNSVKERKLTPLYSEDIKTLVGPSMQALSTTAKEQFQNNDYVNAAKNFETLYYLNKAIGKEDIRTLYFVGKLYQNAKENEKAAVIYDKLVSQKFTGVVDEYEITLADGKVITSNQADADLYKLDTKNKIKKVQSENLEKELYTNAAVNAALAKNHDKAIEYCKLYLASHSGDSDIQKTLSNIYIDAKKYDEYIVLAQDLIAANPNDANVYKYVGLVYGQKGDSAKAKEYFDKAINLTPNDISLYVSVILGILEREKPLVTEMNALGNSKADNDKYKKLLEKRKAIYKEAMPYAEAASKLEPDNKELKSLITKMTNLLSRS